jgi:hypothetical protein
MGCDGLGKTGKLDPRAEEAQFVGYDDESKGFCIYWPKEHTVGIKRDVYFDKNQALQPDEVSIEGVEDVFTKSDITSLKMFQTTPMTLLTTH